MKLSISPLVLLPEWHDIARIWVTSTSTCRQRRTASGKRSRRRRVRASFGQACGRLRATAHPTRRSCRSPRRSRRALAGPDEYAQRPRTSTGDRSPSIQTKYSVMVSRRDKLSTLSTCPSATRLGNATSLTAAWPPAAAMARPSRTKNARVSRGAACATSQFTRDNAFAENPAIARLPPTIDHEDL